MKRKFLLLATALLMTAMGVKAQDAFVVWDKANKTLYFSYGTVPTVGGSWTTEGGAAVTATNVWSGEKVTASGNTPAWHDTEIYYACTKVVFESSFSSVKPTLCHMWFSDMGQLTTIEGLTNFNTSSVTTMGHMFTSCIKLTSLDLSKFDTSAVTDTYGMFHGCSTLTSLDLSNFNTSKVTDMSDMFSECSALTAIFVGDSWSTAAVTSSTDMFTNTNNLVGEDGTTVGSTTDVTYAHTGAGGYLTKKNETATIDGTYGWATFSSTKALDFTGTGITAYRVSDVTSTSATLEEVTGAVAAGTGLLIKGATANVPRVGSGTEFSASENLLVAVTDAAQILDASGAGTDYVLTKDGDNVVFGKVVSTDPATVAVGHAYLHTSASLAPMQLTLGFGDEGATGIDRLPVTTDNGVFYDLQGRRVQNPVKGVYIVNGKKVVIK